MAEKTDVFADFVGEAVAAVIGWVFCMAMLAGAYVLGSWLAPHFGGAGHRDAFGIISVIVIVWLYEHRRADERWSRLQDMIERINDRAH